MESKDRTAVLFPNERKREGKKDPDFTGSVTLGGVTYWLSGWRNQDKNGKHYLSMKIGDAKAGAKKDDARPAKQSDRDAFEIDDSIPF